MTLDTMFIYQYIDANYTTNYLARLITHVTYALIYYPTVSDRATCWLVREERIKTRVGDTDFSCHFHSTASKKEEVIRENAAIIYTNAPLAVPSLTCASAWWSSAHSATLERPAGTRERFRLG